MGEVRSTAIILGGGFALVVGGFILFGINFLVNTFAVVLALCAATMIVLGFGFKSRELLSAFTISTFFVLTSELTFSFSQPLVALCLSLFTLIAITRYSLLKDHDSGWFGAFAVAILSLVFLLAIEIAFGMVHMF